MVKTCNLKQLLAINVIRNKQLMHAFRMECIFPMTDYSEIAFKELSIFELELATCTPHSFSLEIFVT